MALPSTRRPQMVVEELTEQTLKNEEDSRKKALQLRIPKYKKFFMEAMDTWYQNLTKKAKSRFTIRKLKRRALFTLSKVNYDYERLPSNWVSELVELTRIIKIDPKTGKEVEEYMKFYSRKKREFDFGFLNGATVSVTLDALLIQPNRKRSNKVNIDMDKHGNMSQVEIDLVDSDEETIVPKKKMYKYETGNGTGPPIHDLRHEQPPQHWIDAYHKGIHLPRVLQISATTERTVIFWDYEPTFEGDPMKNLTFCPHKHDSFDWGAHFYGPKEDETDDEK